MDPPPTLRRAPSEIKQLPPRTTCLAVVLTSLGVVLLILGFVALGTDHDGAPALFIVAILTLLPGTYVLVNLIGAYRRWPGYRDVTDFADLELV